MVIYYSLAVSFVKPINAVPHSALIYIRLYGNYSRYEMFIDPP